MKKTIFLLPLALTLNAFASTNFETVVQTNVRPGNLAVSSKGEIFVTMHPMDNPQKMIMRFGANGKEMSFNYPVFSKATGEMKNIGIVDAIGIFITKNDILWVLDMGGEVAGKKVSPKFIVWNLNTEKLEKIIPISNDVLASNSFTQDFAIDEASNFAYIADMTIGEAPHSPAIISINLTTGEAKRMLNNSKFLQAKTVFKAEGRDVIQGGKPAKLGLNPITIDANNEWVYFGSMSEGSVFRIKSKSLQNFSISDAELERGIENYGYKPHSDGFKIDSKGNIYVGDVDRGEIGVLSNKKYESYIKSDELKWVDGLFASQDGYVYATVNQLNRHPNLSGKQKDEGTKPYKIIKFKQMGDK
jgi:sugar lactone lactonase YvrE